MKAKPKILFISIAILVTTSIVSWLFLGSSGNQAPNVQMTLLNGKKLDLRSFHGHPVLINFWATTCPGCVEEIPSLAKLYKQLSPQGFEIIGVAMSYDIPSQVKTMTQDKHIPYPITIDRSDSISKAFGTIRLTPTSFLINPKGQIVYQKIGNVDTAKLKAQVEQMLRQSS
ncbi:TlpA disulfide reductase family protein [Acidihalobacter aeolianus]|nr:TlpA disulfide reductase family protein [Acidihalobacter aeolianus]